MSEPMAEGTGGVEIPQFSDYEHYGDQAESEWADALLTFALALVADREALQRAVTHEQCDSMLWSMKARANAAEELLCDLRDRVEALQRERDNLRLALERIASLHSGDEGDPDTFDQAKAALDGLDAPWLNRFENDLERLAGRVGVLAAALREAGERFRFIATDPGTPNGIHEVAADAEYDCRAVLAGGEAGGQGQDVIQRIADRYGLRAEDDLGGSAAARSGGDS